MDKDNSNDRLAQEWENRILCSDESCIGVIGPDGRCKECGLTYKGELPVRSESTPPGHKTDQREIGDIEDIKTGDEEDEASASDDEWSQRTLCSDEGCIGVIGPDGRCKECGRAYEPGS